MSALRLLDYYWYNKYTKSVVVAGFRVCRLGFTVSYIRRGGVLAPHGHCGSIYLPHLRGIIACENIKCNTNIS